MRILLVGGAVRDLLLKSKPKDFDYVVLDSSHEEMLSLGFEKIANSFPVYQKKGNSDQYALARTETSSGPQYIDFKINIEKVSLYQDLKRRDFTINSLALDLDTGEIFDFFGGVNDLNNKQIKHIGNHFEEDPLRIFRAARLSAQLNFSINSGTKIVIKRMLKNKAINNIHPFRIGLEFEKSILAGRGLEFLVQLDELGILKKLIPKNISLKKLKSNFSKLKNEKNKSSFFIVLFNNILREKKLDKFLIEVEKLKFIHTGDLIDIFYASIDLPKIKKYSNLSYKDRAVFLKSMIHDQSSFFKLLKISKKISNIKNHELAHIIKDFKLIKKYKNIPHPASITGIAIKEYYLDQLISLLKKSRQSQS